MLTDDGSMAFALYGCLYCHRWGHRQLAGLPYFSQDYGLYTVNLALCAFS